MCPRKFAFKTVIISVYYYKPRVLAYHDFLFTNSDIESDDGVGGNMDDALALLDNSMDKTEDEKTEEEDKGESMMDTSETTRMKSVGTMASILTADKATSYSMQTEENQT